MNQLINTNVRETTMSLQLRLFLNMEMRSCKLHKPSDRYDYQFIKQVNRDLISGHVHPDIAIDLIWGWIINGGDETLFDSIGFWSFAKRYGRILKRF